MGREVRLLFLFAILFFVGFVSATVIYDDLHLNIQVTNSTGYVLTGTYTFFFNISNSTSCGTANIIYSNRTSLTTDVRGIVSYDLPNVTLDYDKQYWLCYYRNGVLQSTSKITKTPYTFNTMRINASGIVNNSNIDLTNYNISAKFLLGNGSYITDIVATTATTSNSTTWWSGITSWASGWFTEVSNQLRFNETKLNETINAFLGNGTFTGKISWSQAFNGTLARNSTIASYIVAKNNTLGTYVRAKNDSLAIWVLAKGYSTGGGSMNYTNLARINISNTFGAFNQTFDTNVFFIDATRNRIGIGTTNPQNLLNVLGDANVTGNLFINNLKAITWTNAFNGTLARNSTIATYILAKDGLYNNTIKSYLDAKDLSFNTSLKNYLDTKDTNFNNTLKSYLDAKDTSFNNSIASWAGIKFVNASGDTLTGTFNFNGGWQTSGLTISGGDIYAQTGFFYNITGLDVNTLNVNGTILPPTRWNNTFDIGNATLRWNDLYLGGVLYSSGAIYTGGSQVATNSTIASYIVAKNNTLGTYVRAKNDSLASFISGKGYINWVNAINGTLANTKASNTFDAFNQTFDTNVFFIDSTRNRIGIGDTNPSKTLNVKGTFNLTSNATFDTNTFFVDATRNRIGILETNPSKTLTVKGTSNFTDNSTFNTNTFFVDATRNRIGIGTTNPSHKLTVSGRINITNSTKGTSGLIWHNGTGICIGSC